MRFLALFLIAVIGFASLSTAAHAADSVHCDISQELSSSSSMDDCSHHSAKHEKTDGKADTCVHCGYCCMSSVVPPSFEGIPMMPMRGFVFGIVNIDTDSDFLSKLKRPPRSLV